MEALTRRAQALWNEVWFRPAHPVLLRATRAVLALQALWIVLSRPDIPALTTWPVEFWRTVDRVQALSFGIGLLPAPLEWALYAALHVALLLCLAGPAARTACLVAGMLLYHFAPMEEIFVGMPQTFFGGLTVPVLGLLILGCAEAPSPSAEASEEFRWPVVLIRLLFSFNYLFAAFAKIYYSGLGWFTADNMRSWAIAAGSMTQQPLAPWIASTPAVCWAIALGTAVVEFGFPLAAFSRRAARLLVPLALAGHVGILLGMGISFPSLALLLLYVDWERERS